MIGNVSHHGTVEGQLYVGRAGFLGFAFGIAVDVNGSDEPVMYIPLEFVADALDACAVEQHAADSVMRLLAQLYAPAISAARNLKELETLVATAASDETL